VQPSFRTAYPFDPLVLCTKSQNTNIKWFDKPFDRLTVLSKVEGLTTLSIVEGQITMTKIQNPKVLVIED
jgi:hypothetical protein